MAREKIYCNRCGKELSWKKKKKPQYCRDCVYIGRSKVVKCDYCGKEKRIQLWEAKKFEHHFCNMKCKGKWTAENLVGDNASRKRNRGIVECKWCGKKMERTVSKIKQNPNPFCCHKHYALWLRTQRGENTNYWKGGVTCEVKVKCSNCDKPVWRPLYKIRAGQITFFCCKKCEGEWKKGRGWKYEDPRESYLRGVFVSKSGLSRQDIPSEVIECYKQLTAAKKLLKKYRKGAV